VQYGAILFGVVKTCFFFNTEITAAYLMMTNVAISSYTVKPAYNGNLGTEKVGSNGNASDLAAGGASFES
jgi:hypothetical protein